MKKMKLVLVGNGMAGVRTLEELLKLAPDLYDITVFGAEPHGNYNRILLSPVLAGEMSLPEIMLNDLDWYRDNHITLHAGKKVTRVDRVKRKVIAEDGTEAEYDRLLLATGSLPFVPPISRWEGTGRRASVLSTQAPVALTIAVGWQVSVGTPLVSAAEARVERISSVLPARLARLYV